MLPALAGANLIYGLGMLEGGLTWDYAMLVMENEMARMIMQCVKGVSINDEKMSLDVLAQVGIGGEYISHEHTFKHFRELSQAELLDRKNRDGWKAAGSKDLVEKAYDKAIGLIETYKPKPLSDDVQKQLKTIVAEAEAETAEIKAKAKRDRKR